MDKREYFLAALKAGAAYRKDWVLAAFSMIMEEEDAYTKDPYPYRIVRWNGEYRFLDPEKNGDLTLLEGTNPNEPPFHLKEKIKLKAGAIPNLKKDVETTYGNLLFNYLVLVWPFYDKIEYLEGRITAKQVEELIQKRLVDEPEGGAPQPGDPDWKGGPDAPIYVSEYLKFSEAMFSLVGYTQLCVPSATPKALTTHPDIPKLKAKLLEENKDRLHDPAVIAKIEAELVKLDKEWLKGDPSEGFYIKKGSFDVKRKKLRLMYGAEMAFSDGSRAELVANSLDEGWDISKMPSMMNSLREASYNRGALTALGGETVKYFLRVFQNTKIAEQDCGSKLGREKAVTEENYQRFVGFYKINPDGVERLTEENLRKYIGRTITVRSPMYCLTPSTSYCAVCMGDANAEHPKALGALGAEVGSTFMNISMAAAHGKALAVARYDFKKSIT